MSKSIFNSVKGMRPRKNVFNLSHRFRYTTKIGPIVPVFVRDFAPNSDVQVSVHNLTRFLSMLAPAMDDIKLYVHFWKIPYRLLDKNFQEWIGGGMDDADYNPPYFTRAGLETYYDTLAPAPGVVHPLDIAVNKLYKEGSFFDMIGIPGLQESNTYKIPARYVQWYALLLQRFYFNEYVGVEDETGVMRSLWDATNALCDNSIEGDVSDKVYDFFRYLNLAFQTTFSCHAWPKDYFTSALPYVQRGEPVSIPIGGTAPVSIPSQNIRINPDNAGLLVMNTGFAQNGNFNLYAGRYAVSQGYHADLLVDGDGFSDGENRKVHHLEGKIDNYIASGPALTGTADLSAGSAVTINELRVLNSLQVFKERVMRFGHRYIEYLKGFFNQTSSDARLQIPQWLGGGKVNIQIAEVEQNSATESDTTPLGNLAGKGAGFASGFAKFRTHIEEESLIVGLAFLLPDSSYCQGLSRWLTKLNDRFDFYNPSFDHLGEQAILKRELYAEAASQDDMDATLGYTPRFAEYRVWPNETHGDLKSSLLYWTTVRKFSDIPALNKDLIYIAPNACDRLFAIQDGTSNILVDLYFNVAAKQPMSRYGTPMLMA